MSSTVGSLPARQAPSVRRNLAFDVAASIGVGISIAMIWTLMPSAARKDGMAPLGLSLLAAMPFLANLVSGASSILVAKSLRHLTVLRIMGAAVVVLVGLVPLHPMMVLAGLGFWLSLSLGGPFHLQLWGRIYPAEARGRVVSLFGVFRSATVATAGFAGGVVALTLGDFHAIALVGALGVVLAFSYLGLRSADAPTPPRYTARSSLATLFERPRLQRIVFAHCFYLTGIMAAVPLFALVFIDRLDLSLAEVGFIGVVGSIGTTLSYPVWGVIVDRWSSIMALRIGTFCGLLGLIGYAIAGDVVMLLPAAALVGAAGACTDAAIISVLAEETTIQDRSAALAGWNLTTGIFGVAAPVTMSLLLGAGILDVDTGMWAAAIACGIGVAFYLMIGGASRRRRRLRDVPPPA